MTIKDSVFIVTGGSSGIGKATARMLIEKGGKVVITGRDAGKLDRVANEIGAYGVLADVSEQSGIDRTMNETLRVYGDLHGLINNAGQGWVKKIEDYTWEDFEAIYRTNVFGAAMMGQAAAKHFVEKSYGNIVNIASTAALKSYAGGGIYSSSKFALRSLTQAWQAELRKHNIRVFGVNPSEVTTAFNQPNRKERDEVANKLRAEEIAHAIVSALEMDDRGFIPEVTVHATNPF